MFKKLTKKIKLYFNLFMVVKNQKIKIITKLKDLKMLIANIVNKNSKYPLELWSSNVEFVKKWPFEIILINKMTRIKNSRFSFVEAANNKWNLKLVNQILFGVLVEKQILLQILENIKVSKIILRNGLKRIPGWTLINQSNRHNFLVRASNQINKFLRWVLLLNRFQFWIRMNRCRVSPFTNHKCCSQFTQNSITWNQFTHNLSKINKLINLKCLPFKNKISN